MTQIKNLAAGSVFNFAGYAVTLLEPAEGYVIVNSLVGKDTFYGSAVTSFPNSLYQLRVNNSSFLGKLSELDKEAILTKNWELHDKSSWTGKVSALSISEWGKYYANGVLTIPATSDDAFWTRTIMTNYGVYIINRNPTQLIDANGTISHSFGYRPTFYLNPDLNIANGQVIYNNAPNIALGTSTGNQTLYENSTLTLAGNTTDVDIDDVVTIKYQIDSGAVRNLHSAVSNGVDPIAFTKELKYEGGVLKDGNTAITSTLDKDLPHTVSIWAEDQNGGKSAIVTRTFFVVPNRPPQISIDPIATQTDLINSNVINVSGVVTDLDKNDVTVTFSINGGEEQQVYQGPPSAFTFNVLLANLKVGANTVIIKATDTYNTSGTKTLTINKAHNAVPVNKAVARYEIVAPTGTARSVLLWVTRTLGNLNIDASISLTNANEAENYVYLAPTNTGVINGMREDEFAYQGTSDKEKIILKITYNRTDANVIDTIKQISGVLF